MIPSSAPRMRGARRLAPTPPLDRPASTIRRTPRARSRPTVSRRVASPSADHQSPTHRVAGHTVAKPASAAASDTTQHGNVKLPA